MVITGGLSGIRTQNVSGARVTSKASFSSDTFVVWLGRLKQLGCGTTGSPGLGSPSLFFPRGLRAAWSQDGWASHREPHCSKDSGLKGEGEPGNSCVALSDLGFCKLEANH